MEPASLPTSNIERSVRLYWISGSPPAWRVMLGLLLKGAAYESHRLDSAKQEHKAPAYLALNPRGQVPTLVHGATIVRESIAILAYSDRAFDGPILFGTTPAQAARAWQDVMDFESNLRPSVTAVAQILLRGESDARAAELKAAIATLQTELAGVDRRIAETGFLGGKEPAAADCWLYPSLAWIERATEAGKCAPPAALKDPLAAFPNIRAWRRRIESIDGFDGTVPPHWKAPR